MNLPQRKVEILLVEDSLSDVLLVEEALSDVADFEPRLTHAELLSEIGRAHV